MRFDTREMTFTRTIPWSERRRRKLADDHPGVETVRAFVTLEIDESAVMEQLGKRAVGNKSLKAWEIGGLVRVTARKS